MNPEYNVTNQNYRDRRHLRYTGPAIVDVHAHVTRTRPTGGTDSSPPNLEQAERMLEVAAEFGVGRILSMCPPDDIPPLRERFGDRMGFVGPIAKKLDEPDEAALQLLDRFLELGVVWLKFWAAPRGRERGLFLDAPWRIEAARRAIGRVRGIMVHVADPDAWFQRVYTDVTQFGTKEDQYAPLCRLLEEFPEVPWIGAHMGGDPEHPDHLEALLERYPHLYFDTSATKWQVREVSARRDAVRSLIQRHPTRFLFGSDLVTRPDLVRDHYVSRYWCQRTLWESDWEGPTPILDLDNRSGEEEPTPPTLRGLNLPPEVLEAVYHGNANRLLGLGRE